MPSGQAKVKKVEKTYGLRSRLSSTFGKNCENDLPGLSRKPHLRLLEVTALGESSTRIKRKTQLSPQGPTVKRTAFSDVTNAIQRLQIPGFSSEINKLEKAVKSNKKSVQPSKRSSAKNVLRGPRNVSVIPEDTITEEENATLYMSALEEVPEPVLQTQSQPEVEAKTLQSSPQAKTRANSEPPVSTVVRKPTVSAPKVDTESPLTELTSVVTSLPSPTVSYVTAHSPLPAWQLQSPDQPPQGVANFDEDTSKDSNAVADYAPYIFCYLRTREPFYQVRPDFLSQHEHLNNDVRSFCVDWMVEVQETLELNHETLYLGVKNLDLFLSNPKPKSRQYRTPPLPITPGRIRLLACASLLLAAQYDERMPPPPEDWLQMCDRDYTTAELNTMQQQLFCALNFDLGAPLSYRFLRRYARACSIDIDLLTLARYILESSLLDSQFSPESDSKLAASALWLALCMKERPTSLEQRYQLWTPTLQHYSGYAVEDLHRIGARLNAWIRSLPTQYLRTVHSKYSHRVFRKVALVPPLEEL